MRRLVPYILHTRPRSWPIVSCHLIVGFLLAHGFKAISLEVVFDLLIGLVLWVVLLNGGTLALNSAFDKDEGDIGYLNNPPEVPKYLSLFSITLMIIGLILSYFFTLRFFVAYLVCFILSILYSCPPIRLKAVPGFDLLINSLGYGAFTLYGGWAVVNKELNATIIIILSSFFLLFAGLYPLTQIYQYEEDKRHGDRTFTVLLGEKRVLLFSIISITMGFILIFAEVLLRHMNYCSLTTILALLCWYKVLIPWYLHKEIIDAQKGMYNALWVWFITDISVIISILS
ncbi:MAG: prenyltransferase [bacterium]